MFCVMVGQESRSGCTFGDDDARDFQSAKRVKLALAQGSCSASGGGVKC